MAKPDDRKGKKYANPKSPKTKESKLARHKKINPDHPEFELTFDMMLGIRTTVGQVISKPPRVLLESDMDDVLRLRFPGEGSTLTPAHPHRSFKFKDYCPEVFRKIRTQFNIDPAQYIMDVCGNFKYLEFISNSKSGQFFFYSHGRNYMIKTITKGESKFLRKILMGYLQHIMTNPNTLLTRFYGMHRVKPHKKKQVHFLIMGSVFHTTNQIHKTFDLKGSLLKRAASKKEKESPTMCVYKDLDFLEQKIKLQVGPAAAKKLNDQLARDARWLRLNGIMDYSLLLGIHDVKRARREAAASAAGEEKTVEAGAADDSDSDERPAPVAKQRQNSGSTTTSSEGADEGGVGGKSKGALRASFSSKRPPPTRSQSLQPKAHARIHIGGPNAHERRQSNYGLPKRYNKFSRPGDVADFKDAEIAPIGIAGDEAKKGGDGGAGGESGGKGGKKKPEKQEQRTISGKQTDDDLFPLDDCGMPSEDPDGHIYYMGIIDILTYYGTFKKGESALKSIRNKRSEISAVNPTLYADRFCKFLGKAIE